MILSQSAYDNLVMPGLSCDLKSLFLHRLPDPQPPAGFVYLPPNKTFFFRGEMEDPHLRDSFPISPSTTVSDRLVSP